MTPDEKEVAPAEAEPTDVEQFPRARPVVTAAQRWEYRVLREHGVGKQFHLTLQRKLNELGEQGWEVCGVTVTEGSDWALGMNGYTAILKRPFVRAELRS